jgi:DNA-binding ferritin-like protein
VSGPTFYQLHLLYDKHYEDVSDVIRKNEGEVWFLSEHLVDVPLVRAD